MMGTASRPTAVVVSVGGRSTLTADDAGWLESIADATFLSRNGPMSIDDAVSSFRHADIVAVTPKVAPDFDRVLLNALPGMRGVVLHATGYDFLNIRALERHGVALSVLPDYSTTSVAEHTLGMILSMSRRIHLGNDRSRGRVPDTISLRGHELAGRTLGIIGCGRIGSRVARFGAAFGMTVLAHDIDPQPVREVDYVGRDQLLAHSDVVTLHCPIEFGAPPMIGAGEIARMRRGSLLVNSSRTGLVDAEAVVASIRSGHLRGYALDDAVLGGPAVADLLEQGRILQTGHSAWWSDEVLARGARMWAEHIAAMVEGRPLDLVRPDDLDGDRLAG